MSSETETYTSEEAQLHFAKNTNLRMWELLGMTKRSREQDEEMLYAANACNYHWLNVGTGLNHQRGEWMIAHVHTVLENAAEALRHAERCEQLTEEYRELMQDFDLAYSFEALARAHALSGNLETAERYLREAEIAGKQIADGEDYKIFWGDLHAGRWYGLEFET